MGKKKETRQSEVAASAAEGQTLGEYLTAIRAVRRMTLREVEEGTAGDVSNAYLSQLENNKITRPSPNILHSLARVYVVPYDTLMEKAGYLPTSSSAVPDALRAAGGQRHGRAATFAEANLTQEEEESLLEYLAFLRSRRSNKRAKPG